MFKLAFACLWGYVRMPVCGCGCERACVRVCSFRFVPFISFVCFQLVFGRVVLVCVAISDETGKLDKVH